ncbi:hypothetical protein ACR6C2_37770 [Streptomyces sp. INA 01156]
MADRCGPLPYRRLVHQPASRTPGRGQSAGPRRDRQAGQGTAAGRPGGGIGHGLLSHLNPQTAMLLHGLAAPQIGFNYLGRFGSPDDSAWAPADEAGTIGGGADDDMAMPHVVEINAVTQDGPDGPRLVATWTWAGEILEEPEVRELAGLWFESLQRLATRPARPVRSAASPPPTCRSSPWNNTTSTCWRPTGPASRTSCRWPRSRRACSSTACWTTPLRTSTTSSSTWTFPVPWTSRRCAPRPPGSWPGTQPAGLLPRGRAAARRAARAERRAPALGRHRPRPPRRSRARRRARPGDGDGPDRPVRCDDRTADPLHPGPAGRRPPPAPLTNHHILLDGWSMPLLLEELFTLYETRGTPRRCPLPRLSPTT